MDIDQTINSDVMNMLIYGFWIKNLNFEQINIEYEPPGFRVSLWQEIRIGSDIENYVRAVASERRHTGLISGIQNRPLRNSGCVTAII